MLKVAEPVSRKVDDRILEILPEKKREQFLEDLSVIVDALGRMTPQSENPE